MKRSHGFWVVAVMAGVLGMAWIAGRGAAKARGAGAADGGPLGVHPENPHYFLFRGKPTVLIGSTEHYGAVLNLDFDYGKYLDELARCKLNVTRTFMGTYREIPGSFGITENTLGPAAERFIAPWARVAGAPVGEPRFDLSRYDDKYFERLRDFVAQAAQRGVVVECVLFCTIYDDKLWAANPMNPKNHVNDVGGAEIKRTEVFTLKHPKLLALQEGYVRKVVGELKDFDNLYWEIINEPYFAGPSDEWQAQIAKVIWDEETRLGGQRRHLIAQNIANHRKKVEKVTPHVSILNFHYAYPPETVAMNYHHNLPIGDDETGFRGKEDVYYRTEAWDFFVAGGAEYNNLDYSFTAKHPAGTLAEFKSPGGGGVELRKQLTILKTFFDGLDFVHMKPMNGAIRKAGQNVIVDLKNVSPKDDPVKKSGKVSVRCFAQEGKTYVLYFRGSGGTNGIAPGTASATIDLPAGEWRVEWMNTRSGKVEKAEDVKHAGGERELASPTYSEDVVVKVWRK